MLAIALGIAQNEKSRATGPILTLGADSPKREVPEVALRWR